jgi:hypothetical protein
MTRELILVGIATKTSEPKNDAWTELPPSGGHPQKQRAKALHKHTI